MRWNVSDMLPVVEGREYFNRLETLVREDDIAAAKWHHICRQLAAIQVNWHFFCGWSGAWPVSKPVWHGDIMKWILIWGQEGNFPLVMIPHSIPRAHFPPLSLTPLVSSCQVAAVSKCSPPLISFPPSVHFLFLWPGKNCRSLKNRVNGEKINSFRGF